VPRPIIALLTDFGTSDHYAGAMKGVMLGICPEATLVDISHGVAPGDVLGAALELAASYRYFPAGTIFLVVVDPGVGSSRRAVAAQAGSYRFVAPDNGVLTLAFDEGAPDEIVELTESRYARNPVSRTFEGRDRFAPAAAWLAQGIALRDLGRPAGSWHRLHVPAPSIDRDGIDGEIVRIDRFGNLITNVGRHSVEAIGAASLRVRIGSHEVSRVVSTYAEIEPGELCALFGSSDHLENAANGKSAAAMTGVVRGAPVRIERG
jgi:hypothetical protein